MDIFAKVGSALLDIKRAGAENVRAGAENVGGALEGLRRRSQGPAETQDNGKDLRELRELALEYHWEEMRAATEDFSETRRLGAGASGTVYRGTLEEGTDVAVKIIEGLVGGGFEEEVRLLSKCRHPNVVMLLGFAREPREPQEPAAGVARDAGTQDGASAAPTGRRALVYELLSGGDVEDRLLKPKQGQPFLWRDRLRTAIDMARGLAHLHKHRPEIFHRDIKPPNVLFGADGAARIADFGLACVSKKDAARELAVDVAAGTPGYADPLYARTGIVTEASEVYSMGTVLIQLLTRKPPALVSSDGSWWFLLSEILPEQSGAKDRLLRMLDAQACWPHTVSTTLANLALLCIHVDVDQRPSFMDLAVVLQDLVEVELEAKARSVVETASGQVPAAPVASVGAQVLSPERHFVQAGQFMQAGQPAVRQVGAMWPPSFADGAGVMRATSFADAAGVTRAPSFADGAVHEGVRPLHDSRIVRGTSFIDANVQYVSGQVGYQYPRGAPQMHPGHAAVGYAPSNVSLGAYAPRCAEVYRPPQPVQPIQHGVSMYVQR